MKKYIYALLILTLFSAETKANQWDLSTTGQMGLYYGFADAKQDTKYQNRTVLRLDQSLKADYKINSNHSIGIHASTTIQYREHDYNRKGGEYRFYPYLIDKSTLGEFYLGYVNNSANMLHKGAKDITFLKIDDTNTNYFLDNPNWNNGYKKVYFATPRSTAIMNDGRAAKLTYISPYINNTKFGFSYTPETAHRRGLVSRYANYTKEDGYTFGLQNKQDLTKGTIYTSFGYGLFNQTDNEISFGLTYEYKNFNIATGYKKAYIDGNKNPITTQKINSYLPAYFDNYRESEAYNISMGYKWDNFKTNIAYLNTKATNTRHQDNLILWSNVYSMNKHLDLFFSTAYLNYHELEKKDNNRGYGVITGIGIKF